MKKSRSAAIEAGEKFYNTGKPCKRGHVAKRSTMDGSCSACRAENQREERARIKAAIEG